MFYPSSPGPHGSHPVGGSPSHASPPSSGVQSLTGQVKTVLNRPSGPYLADKINDLTRVMAPHLRAHGGLGSAHHHHHGGSKDLDSAFLLVLGDVFGSLSVHAAKYGPGWNLGQISRHR